MGNCFPYRPATLQLELGPPSAASKSTAHEYRSLLCRLPLTHEYSLVGLSGTVHSTVFELVLAI